MKHLFSSSRKIVIVLFFTSATGLAAYTFESAIKSLGPGNNGYKSGLQMVELWHKMSAKLKIGRSAQAFLDFLDKAVQEFDFMQLYQSKFMAKRAGGVHTVTFRGQNLPDSYRLDLVKGRYTSVGLNNFGNFGAEFGLKKNDKSIVGDRSFAGYLKARGNLSQFSHENGAAFLAGLQKVLDPGNLTGSLNAAKSGIYANMKGESRKLLDAYAKAFPNFSRTLHRYTSLRSLVKVKEYQGKKYTEMKMVGRLKMGALKKDFAEIHEYLEDVEEMLRFRLLVNNSKGKRISSFYLNSKRKEITWSIYTRNGKLVPFDGKGRPVFDQEFALTDVKKYTFYSIANMKINIYGLKFDTRSVIVRGDWRKTKNSGKFDFRMTKIPTPKITGAFYHVIPTWLIDIGIPGNIQELAGKMTKVMQKGNKGKGTRFGASWKSGNPRKVIVSAYGQTEIIDNRFIRFALRIWSGKMRPNKKALKQLSKFQSKLTGSLLKDMQKLAS